MNLKKCLFWAICLIVVSSAVSAREIAIKGCTTNSGILGEFYDGMLGVLIVPEETESVRLYPSGYKDKFGTVGNKAIFVTPAIRTRNMVQLRGNGNNVKTDTIIEFLDDGDQVLDTCSLALIPFDASIHDISSLMIGNCDYGTGNQILHMRVWEVRPINLPENHSEAEASLRIDLANDGPGRIVLYGISAGVGTFAWNAGQGNGNLKGICPVTVTRTFGK